MSLNSTFITDSWQLDIVAIMVTFWPVWLRLGPLAGPLTNVAFELLDISLKSSWLHSSLMSRTPTAYVFSVCLRLNGTLNSTAIFLEEVFVEMSRRSYVKMPAAPPALFGTLLKSASPVVVGWILGGKGMLLRPLLICNLQTEMVNT